MESLFKFLAPVFIRIIEQLFKDVDDTTLLNKAIELAEQVVAFLKAIKDAKAK